MTVCTAFVHTVVVLETAFESSSNTDVYVRVAVAVVRCIFIYLFIEIVSYEIQNQTLLAYNLRAIPELSL